MALKASDPRKKLFFNFRKHSKYGKDMIETIAKKLIQAIRIQFPKQSSSVRQKVRLGERTPTFRTGDGGCNAGDRPDHFGGAKQLLG